MKQLIFFIFLIASIHARAQREGDTLYDAVKPDTIFDDEEYIEETEQNDTVRRAPIFTFEKVDTFQHNVNVNWRTINPKFIDELKNDRDFLYVKNGIPKIKDKTKTNPVDLGKTWLYIAIAAFVAILVWYLINSNLIIFTKKSKAYNNADSYKEERNIFNIDYTLEIQNAVKQQNYRLAVRLHYLQLLKLLAGKNVITYQPEKTNFDYVLQLKPTSYHEEFFSLTRHYEYCWYGLFTIDEARYNQIQQGFTGLQQKIG